ncbi:MAG TPA: hypothetical protein VKR21_16685 [Solirubrobacteraceae bacterium]|nr:hypothetical protein [Solirubrobacteraceae bacterium]
MRGIVYAVAAVLAMILAVSAAAAESGRVACPLQRGAPSGGDVQWAFSDSGRPAGKTIRSSYVHGRGSWTNGRATGTACTTDSPAQNGGVRDLVLAVEGKSKLTARVRQNGLLGVRLVLRMRVRASDDQTCPQATTGTLTLFASYYSVHRDTLQVHFSSRCVGHDLTYSGSALHVYIARHGAQVSAP